MTTKVSSKFKLLTQHRVYEGKTDPMDHLNSYKNLMSLQGYSNEVMYKAVFCNSKRVGEVLVQKAAPRDH